MASNKVAKKTQVPGALSFQQLEALWIHAGGSPKLAPTMAAIALAESGGRPTAHNYNPATGDDSYGLWQINYYGGNRTVRTARWGPPEGMYNPLNNARAAVQLAGDSYKGLGNWSTYNSGAFTSHLPSNAEGVNLGGLSKVWNAEKGLIKDVAPWVVPFGTTNPKAPTNSINSVTGALGSIMSRFVAGLAIGGGVLLLLLGIALVGADIGIETLNKGPARKVRNASPVGRITQRRRANASASEEQARRQREEERREEKHREGIKLTKARATELRTRTRHRRKNKAEQEKEVKRAYIEGARDATV